MKVNPKISIIINNYNYARFLPAAIESALGQTYLNMELLVVDDGSTDDSRTIIQSYEGRLKAIYKENGGQASAFNLGLLHSTGEIVIFLDSDDVLAPGCLEEVAQSFISDSELVCTRWYLENIDQDGRKLNSTNPPQGVDVPTGSLNSQILKTGWRFNNPPTSGNAFLKSCLEQFFPIPEEMTRCADVYLFANVAVRGRIGMISKVLGCYRQNLASTSHHMLSRVKVLREVLAADITDRSLIAFFGQKSNTKNQIRNYWVTVGDEVLRRILLKFAQNHCLPKDMYCPISVSNFLNSHTLAKNIKYCIGLLFVILAPSERIAFWGAGTLLGKHNLWGVKRIY